MGEDPRTGSAPVTHAEDPEQIQREIEQTREQLGDTVEALARKADIKAQAKQRIDQTRTSITEKKQRVFAKAKQGSPDSASTAATQATQKARENPLPLAATAAFLVGFLAGRKRRR